MSNLAVINIVGLSSLSRESLFGSDSALERVISWGRSIPNAAGIVLLAKPGDDLPQGAVGFGNSNTKADSKSIEVFYRESWSEDSLISSLAEISAGRSKSIEALFYTWGDNPLVDGALTETLWKLHHKYDAEYTFADGYPYGLAPEILSSSLPPKLVPLSASSRQDLHRDSLFEILRKDINAFDVETHLSPKDLRMDRVSISCDTRRNRNILTRLYEAGGVDAESLCRIIPENRLLLRDLPSYFPIQVGNHCPQSCSYCPFPKVFGDPRKGHQFMSPDSFADLCRRIVDFAGDAVISPSLWGEPASHPQIGELIDAALAAGERAATSRATDRNPPAATTRVLIETSGIGWEKSLLERLASDTEKGRLLWIISLDASDPEIYKALRGEGLQEAEDTARLLVSLFGESCWVQAVRMEDNEEHLEFFYKKWNKMGAQVIIQKYNSYAAYLPEKQPADLSPLERFPCWHLKRDMPILINGDVPICREDLGRSDTHGNAFADSLKAIWSNGDSIYARHVNGDYPKICRECDEYYTFNF